MVLKNLLILIFIALFAISLAEAQSTVGIVIVNGTLYCTANGAPDANGNATPVFPNASVQVVCSPDVVATTPVNGTANANGVYRVNFIPRRNATVDMIVPTCRLFVLTPLSSCNPTLPSVGLVSNIRFVRTEFVLVLRFTYMVATGFTQLQA